MPLGDYLDARDDFFAAEVYRELRKADISDEQADALVDRAFERAKSNWEFAQTKEATEALRHAPLPTANDFVR